MSDELPKADYLAARDKCDAEADALREQIESARQRGIITENRDELLVDIESAINELVSGDTDDEDFYREFLSRMVVNDRDNVDVYLNLLPFKWSYAISKTAPPSDKSPATGFLVSPVGTEDAEKPVKPLNNADIRDEQCETELL
jgi:hypothetical protein